MGRKVKITIQKEREVPMQKTIANLDAGEGIVVSSPPPGKHLVTNLYVDPETGRLVVEYDANPQG